MQPLTDEQREIVAANIPWVVNRAAARYKSCVDRDTLIQEGVIGLARAVQKLDPAKGKLSTYSTFHIDQKMGLAEARAWRDRNPEGNPVAHPPTAPEEPDPDYDAEKIARAVASLPERERLIIKERYWLDKTQREIASTMGVTHSRIGQLEMRAKAELRKLLA